jgi:hypothetical protein
MMRERKFDVSEIGMTYYLRTLDFDYLPFIAVPVFPNRVFRHSAIYINTTSGIREPTSAMTGIISRREADDHEPRLNGSNGSGAAPRGRRQAAMSGQSTGEAESSTPISGLGVK